MKYFVKELPGNCSLCDCGHTKPYNNRHRIDGEKFCGILNENVEVYYYGDSRPGWCPLRKIPKRKGLQGLTQFDTDNHYEMGWNACIDEILGEQNE